MKDLATTITIPEPNELGMLHYRYLRRTDTRLIVYDDLRPLGAQTVGYSHETLDDAKRFLADYLTPDFRDTRDTAAKPRTRKRT